MEQKRSAAAYAQISGGSKYPGIHGYVSFNQLPDSVLVTARIYGLPSTADGMGVFAFHIHEGGSCTGNAQDEFADTKDHYNPKNHAHPYHAGDLPPLFANNGYAYMSVITDRFTVNDIIGKAVIIHDGVDDFTTQPAGNAGTKIACGQIKKV